MPSMQEFNSQLAKANVAGRPLSVTLARFQEHNNRLIGCSSSFLQLTGRPRKDVMGMNCRFMNEGVEMASTIREQLHESVITGEPFLGILKNKRYVGNGRWEVFDNLLHMVSVAVGVRNYIIGMQVDVTGLNLNIAKGSQLASRLQIMFDSVLYAGVNSWIQVQEHEFQSAPLYLCIGQEEDSDDQMDSVEEQNHSFKQEAQAAPERRTILVHPFLPLDCLRDTPSTKGSKTFNDMKHRQTAHSDEDASTESPGSGNDTGNGTSDHTDSPSFSPLPPSSTKQPSAEVANPSMAIPTMKTQLQALHMEDPDTVIIARGISNLGLQADEKLRDFFSTFGSVKDVHIPHAFKKKSVKTNSREIRMPGRCFIVMGAPEERAKILAEATQYLVHGVEVTLEAFSAKQPSQ